MNNLLKLAIEAHGGPERWPQFNVVRATPRSRARWHLKGQPDVLKNVQVVAQLHRRHLVTHLIGKDRRYTLHTATELIDHQRHYPRASPTPADKFLRSSSMST
jgi:hypothetical protein